MALKLKGSTSGFVALDSPAVAGNNTITLPDSNGSANAVWANDNTAGVTTYTQVTINRNGDIVTPGTLSIGGTITYEDVTNVDSVGLVTAAQGVRINGGGLSVIGITTGISLSGVLTATNDVGIGDSIFHIGDSDTSIRFPAADTVAVSTGSSERLRIDSTGRIQIGIAANFGLDYVNLLAQDGGGIAIAPNNVGNATSGTILGSLSFQGYLTGAAYDSAEARISAIAAANHTGSAAATDMVFYTKPSSTGPGSAPTERLRITSAGNVLAGHTGTYGSGKSQIFNTSQYLLDLSAWSADANGPTVDFYKSRNATIGSSTVVQSGDVIGRLRFLGNDGANSRTAAQITTEVDTTPGTNDMPGRLVFATTADGGSSSTERMRIDSSGRVMIGNTAAASLFTVANNLVVGSGSGSEGMTIYSDSTNDGYICFADGTGDPAYRIGQIIYSHQSNMMQFRTNGNTNRLVINSSGNSQFVGIVTATQFIPTEYQVGNRNILYNGSMQIAQYATQVTGCTLDKYRTCDRWRCIISNGGTYTIEQTDEGPADTGFNHALRFTCTTADNAGQNNLGNADGVVAIEQRLEGFDVQGIQKGTASAKKLTLSFWCKSNNTGTYNIELFDNDNQRRVGFQYTVSSSGTWEQKTVTFPAEANSTYPLGNDNGDSLRVRWFLAAGNNWRTGTNSGSWAGNTTNQRAENNTSLSKATSNYFALTGVQMEVGEEASPFEWLNYGTDLRRCQRYYQEIGGGNYGSYAFASGYTYNSGNNIAAGVYLAVPLRASPTVAVTANLNGTTQGAGGNVNSPSVPSYDIDTNWLPIGWGITSDLGANNYGASVNNNANAKFTMSAEL